MLMADQEKPAQGQLMVGITEDGREIVVNHPDLKPDADGCGHIVFSPDQAMNLELLLARNANIIRGIVCGHCGDLITQSTGWATARFNYCFKPECQEEFYKEAQEMIRKRDPELADLLAEGTARRCTHKDGEAFVDLEDGTEVCHLCRLVRSADTKRKQAKVSEKLARD
jgi:hypothetical protein